MDELYRAKRLPEKIAGVPLRTIYRWISEGKFPKGTLIGDRTRVWSESELKNWLQSRKDVA